MFYVGPHARERIVTAEVMKLERRQAEERARRAAAAQRAGSPAPGAAPRGKRRGSA